MASELPARFHLQRHIDVSGISGTGTVALGVRWPDGTASVRWLGPRPSIVFWDSMDDAEAVHGHAGATEIVWADEAQQAVPGALEALRTIRDDMARARSSGDEWASEWLGEVWTQFPLALRAAVGDQDAADELTATGEQQP